MTEKSVEKVIETFKKNYNLVPLEVFKDNPYKVLVSTLLSSRTKDEVTLKASKRFFKTAPTLNSLSRMNSKEIEKLIYPVGFYKNKAKYLKKLCKILKKDFGGKIPANRKDLLTLPGVGRKTANLVLNRAFDKDAISVDTHVHRISNLLGWVSTKNPSQTEKALLNKVPKKYWKDINRLFVSIGRKYNSKIKLKEFLENSDLI